MTFGAKNISASIHKFTVYDILFQGKLFIENNFELPFVYQAYNSFLVVYFCALKDDFSLFSRIYPLSLLPKLPTY
mgnify:CR=1 FL=1